MKAVEISIEVEEKKAEVSVSSRAEEGWPHDIAAS